MPGLSFKIPGLNRDISLDPASRVKHGPVAALPDTTGICRIPIRLYQIARVSSRFCYFFLHRGKNVKTTLKKILKKKFWKIEYYEIFGFFKNL